MRTRNPLRKHKLRRQELRKQLRASQLRRHQQWHLLNLPQQNLPFVDLRHLLPSSLQLSSE